MNVTEIKDLFKNLTQVLGAMQFKMKAQKKSFFTFLGQGWSKEQVKI